MLIIQPAQGPRTTNNSDYNHTDIPILVVIIMMMMILVIIVSVIGTRAKIWRRREPVDYIDSPNAQLRLILSNLKGEIRLNRN